MHYRLRIRSARNYTPPHSRSRVLYAVLAVAVIALGCCGVQSSCHCLRPLEIGGDGFWALMVFVGFGFLLPRASTLIVALLALTFSWGVEFSQLYHAPWIDAARATLPGRLVLGSSFNLPAIWFKDACPVATKLSRDWRNAPALNLGEALITKWVSLAIRLRSGRVCFE